MTSPRISALFSSLFLAMLLIGCGGSEFAVTPNYHAKEFRSATIKRPAVAITSVTDRRNVPPMVVGTANVGMMNKKVPFRLTEPVAAFVKKAFDSLYTGTAAPDDIVRADAYIDSLTAGEYTTFFGEYGRVVITMLFSVPVRRDSAVVIATRYDDVVRSGVDVTASLEPLLYTGVAACAQQFAAKAATMDLRRRPETVPADTGAPVPVPAVIAPPAKNAAVIEAVDTLRRPKEHSDIGAMYSSGGKVVSGIRIFYNTLMQKDSSRSLFGFGYDLDILSVDNTKDFIKGTMVTYGGSIVFRQLFSDAPVAPYLGLRGTLTAGSESITYPDHTETTFFFGPKLNQMVGLSFNKKFYLEAGLFEILLMGSKMLPSDVGFTAGLSIGF